jgi:hypothetical protein
LLPKTTLLESHRFGVELSLVLLPHQLHAVHDQSPCY